MTKSALAAIALALALAGCSGPALPVYGDAFKGLYNRSSADVPADAQVAVRQPVGIIFSDNVETYFEWVKKSNEYWSAVVPLSATNPVSVADSDPNFVGGRVLAMLKQHFPQSEVVKDFNQAVATGKQAVCLIDVRVKPMEPYGDRSIKVDIAAYFFDAQMNPVSRMAGHGERYVPIGAMDARVQPAVDDAIQQLDAKIAALAR